jgi:dihydrodipicolinate synthase/N-acetylneuraminate lyase
VLFIILTKVKIRGGNMAKRYPQAIMVSCETPWDDNEEFLEDVFRRQVRAMLGKGFNHIYIFGTAGEGYAVTLAQYRKVVGVFREEIDKEGAYANVCVIAMSTAQAVERVGIAYDMGFRIFQLTLPSWGALTDEEYMTFFRDVCSNFPDAKFIHYNLPYAKRILLGRDYRRLEEAVPNLVGTKNTRSDINDIHSIVNQPSELQHFWGEQAFPIACMYGEASLLSTWGGLFTSKTKEFFHYGVTRQLDKLFRMFPEYLAVMSAFDEPSLAVEGIDGAWDKMIVRASGIDMPLRLLSPYQGHDQETYEACVRNVRENYPGWID